MKLVITEKPSVAIDIAKVLGVNNRKDGYIESKEYIVSWAVGHLVSLSLPDAYDKKYQKWNMGNLPILPEIFKTEVLKSTKKQFYILKKLFDDGRINEIICATDAGREGQLIFEYIYQKTQSNKPVKRLWISSMTDEAIKEGFNNLKDNKQYENLYQSAVARARADWLYGINFTQLYSLKHNTMFSVGRVQTPTLNLIVERDLEIENFIPKDYFELEGEFEQGLRALYFKDDESKFDHKEDLERIKNSLGSYGIIKNIMKEEKQKNRPQLFDLTSLQKSANNIYGYTAKETLDIAQSLYEKHKLITYPRTDSKHLGDDMKEGLKALLKGIKRSFNPIAPFIDKVLDKGLNLNNRIINNEKVSDHHAIIVTDNIKNYNPSKLTNKENNIVQLIMIRFVAALSTPKQYLETEIEIMVNNYLFKKKFNNVLDFGYEEIINYFFKKDKADDEIVSNFNIGDKISLLNSEILEEKTKSKTRYTESSLLSAMENISRDIEDTRLKDFVRERGLGTPATRAGIIETLIKRKYIKREKKNLISTDYGRNLIKIVHDGIKSVETTAIWEERLNLIEKGQEIQDNFIADIKSNVSKLIDENKAIGEDLSIKREEVKEIIGICPLCSQNVYESKVNFYCEGFKNNPPCKFSLWKNDKYFASFGRKITKIFAKNILKGNKAAMKNLKSKKGSTFNAEFSIKEYKPYIKWEMKFK